MSDYKLPTYSIDLINHLNQLYPDRCPPLGSKSKEVWYAAGQRSVVNHLLTLLEDGYEGLPNILSHD